MKVIRDILLVAWLNLYPMFKRQRLMLVLSIPFGLSPLVFISIFGNGGLLAHGFVGAIVYAVGFVSMLAPLHSLAWDRHIKSREMTVAMPVHPISYAFGVVLAPLLLSVPLLLIFIAIAAWWGILGFSLRAVIGMVIALFLCWSSLSALSFTIATYFPKTNPFKLGAVALVLGFVIVFLPPVYYSKEMLGNFSWISFLAPTSNAASLIGTYLGLSALPRGDIAVHWLALIFTTVLFALLASAKARWREV